MKSNIETLFYISVGIIIGLFCVIILLGTKFVVSTCNSNDSHEDSIKVLTDTMLLEVPVVPDGEFVYNLPCKVKNINQSKEGQSLLFIWLHGGVYASDLHSLRAFNHLNCCEADEKIVGYLEDHGIKSIVLFPICHKATVPHCVDWSQCYDDVKAIIDDYIDKGLVNPKRIYLAGSSDGGTGAWDYAKNHGETFAAIIAMSCGNAGMTKTPMYFFNTASERDYTQEIEALKSQGANVQYKHCPDVTHGYDAKECTEEFLDIFFSNIKEQ